MKVADSSVEIKLQALGAGVVGWAVVELVVDWVVVGVVVGWAVVGVVVGRAVVGVVVGWAVVVSGSGPV